MLSSILLEIRRRLLIHAAAFLLVWPLLAAYATTITIKEQLVFYSFTWPRVFLGSLLATGLLSPEYIIIGVGFTALSLLIFSSIAAAFGAQAQPDRRVYALEPLAFALGGVAGIAFEFPVVLRNPLFMVFRHFAVGISMVLLAFCAFAAAAIVGREIGRVRGAIASVVAVAIVMAAMYGVALPAEPPSNAEAATGGTVILGLDSLSQLYDVSALRSFTRDHNGTWYEKPVPPGLMTNTVWPSIVIHRPISETGVFLVQQPNWRDAPFNLVTAAEQAGYETWSFFSDQSTTSVGSDADFDVNRSGPVGWLQIATSGIKDASVFLPVVLPSLPRIPLAMSPPNQSGTFAFDVRREIREILTVRSKNGKPVFVAAHLDYLHQPRFPGFSEMVPSERRAVRGTPADAMKDLSIDHRYPRFNHDVLGLYNWKVQRLQQLVAQEIERTRFLAPDKRNRLVLFSDHGDRTLISLDNFGDRQFHHVILVTYGLPGRPPEQPISLLDVGELVGLSDPARPGPAEPLIEYTTVTPEEWQALVKTGKLLASGKFQMRYELLEQVGRKVRGYRPYDDAPQYFPRPTRPAESPTLVRTEARGDRRVGISPPGGEF